MALIYLVRHGEAAAAWQAARDPGLSPLGLEQAEHLVPEMETLLQGNRAALFSSPLQRCQQTAQPLAQAWKSPITLMPQVAEIPSPTQDLQHRGAWLRQAMAGSWQELVASSQAYESAVDYEAWRQDLHQALLSFREPAIIFTHFIAINIAKALACKSRSVVSFRPANASVTVMEVKDKGLFLRRLGKEGQSTVN